MQRFFFHVHDGEYIHDGSGTALPDLDAARRHALIFASDLLKGQPDRFWQGEEWRMEVTDEWGLSLFELKFMATESPAVTRARSSAPPEPSPSA